jgi:hypothetical protein
MPWKWSTGASVLKEMHPPFAKVKGKRVDWHVIVMMVGKARTM